VNDHTRNVVLRKSTRATPDHLSTSVNGEWKLHEQREQPSYGQLTKYTPLKQLRLAMLTAMLLRRLLATKRRISRASSCR
jgi:hypothetical protein